MIFRLVAAVAIVAIALLAQPIVAGGQNLQLPCRFHGIALWDCYSAPEGAVIEALIAGDTYYAAISWTLYGDDDYGILIVPPEEESYVDGTPVYFKIGGRDATQVGTWEAGGNVRLDLTHGCRSITTTYPSDTSNLVALSTDGVEYGSPQNAVATWAPSPWPEVDGATWISSAYHVEDTTRASWREFTKSFHLPEDATEITAVLEITADDSYEASLNGSRMGSGSAFHNIDVWSAVPTPGVNVFTVAVKNTGTPNRSWQKNPTGLAYVLTVTYALPTSRNPAATPTSTPTSDPVPAVGPGTGPTDPAPEPTAEAAPTVAPGPMPTAEPTPAPPRQYAQSSGGSNTGKVVGVAFFGMVDILFIGLFAYLVWRFFVHPRVQT